MTDEANMQTEFNIKRRKEALDKKRGKKQTILAETEIEKDEKSVARHKRFLILKHRREAKCLRSNVASQEIGEPSNSVRDMISQIIGESSSIENDMIS
jgi:hypothetical protein